MNRSLYESKCIGLVTVGTRPSATGHVFIIAAENMSLKPVALLITILNTRSPALPTSDSIPLTPKPKRESGRRRKRYATDFRPAGLGDRCWAYLSHSDSICNAVIGISSDKVSSCDGRDERSLYLVRHPVSISRLDGS